MTFRLTGTVQIALLALLALVALQSPANAVEKSQEFLARLRERGLHDYAAVYLEQMRTSPLASEEFKQTIDLELAVTLADGARLNADPISREDELRRALASFDKCLEGGDGNEPFRGAALRSKGKTQLALAASQITQSERPTNRARKDELVESARKFLVDAGKTFSDAVGYYHRRKEELARSTAVNKKELEEERKSGVLEALLLEANADLELGRSYEPGKPDGKKVLERAAERYGYLAEQYRKLLAGRLATVRQAECYDLLGDGDKALGAIEAVVDTTSKAPETDQVSSEAIQLYLKIATGDKQKKFAEAMELGEAFLSSVANDQAPAALAVEYYLALTHQKLAAASKKEDAAARKNISEARRRARYVARFPGPFQTKAQALIASLGRGEIAADAGEATTFAAARAKADTARDSWQSMLATPAADPNADKARLTEAEDQRILAFENYQLALRLADAQTPHEELTQVRYTLAYLFWDMKQVEDAAVLGEFVAKDHPQHQFAPKAAQIALAAYQKMTQDAPAADKPRAQRHVQRLAEHMLATWPDKPEAEAALLTMLEAAISAGQFEAAVAQVEKIPADDPRRAMAELRGGQLLWIAYRKEQAAGEKAKQDPEPLRLAAQKLLEAGYERIRARGPLDPAAAGGVLSLAQLYFDAGNADKAVPLVDDPELGLLALAASKKLPTESPLSMEIYKNALQAYVSTSPPKLAEAEKTMKTLDELAAKNPQAAADLTLVYVGLGRELHNQIQSLTQRGDQAQADAVTKSLETFLERVGERKEGQNYQTLVWLAGTFTNLAGGVDALGRANPEGAKQLAKAAALYQRVLDEAAREPSFLPKPELNIGLRLQLAKCHRRAGDYQAATDQIAELLKANPRVLDIQIEAARILQDRGDVEDWKYLSKAIQGDPPSQIWGWGPLAQRVAKQPERVDAFHDARLNLALCRYRLAQRGPTELRPKVLDRAKQDILQVAMLYPEMGGAVWRPRYDGLLRQIQKDLGEPTNGLPNLTPPAPVARGAAAAPAAKPR